MNPLPLNPSRNTGELVHLFTSWRTENGFADFKGDAEDLQACEDLDAGQRQWLRGFVKVWNVVTFREECEQIAAGAVEIAAFELGPEDMRRYVRVLHVTASDFGLFLVEDFTKCDEDREPSTFTKWANSTLAFQHAFKLAQEEAADITDTVEG